MISECAAPHCGKYSGRYSKSALIGWRTERCIGRRLLCGLGVDGVSFSSKKPTITISRFHFPGHLDNWTNSCIGEGDSRRQSLNGTDIAFLGLEIITMASLPYDRSLRCLRCAGHVSVLSLTTRPLLPAWLLLQSSRGFVARLMRESCKTLLTNMYF